MANVIKKDSSDGVTEAIVQFSTNTDTVNTIRSIVVRELDYARRLNSLGIRILQPGYAEQITKSVIGDPSVYNPEEELSKVIWDESTMTEYYHVPFSSVDGIAATLAELKKIQPSLTWADIACLAFWMLFSDETTFQTRFVIYEIMVEGVNPFTLDQISNFNYATALARVKNPSEYPKFRWPINATSESTLDVFRRVYKECAEYANVDLNTAEDWYCTGLVNPPVCPYDLSVDYAQKPKPMPTTFDSATFRIAKMDRNFFNWMTYESCLLDNATSPVEGAPKVCEKPTVESKSKPSNYETGIKIGLGITFIGAIIWSIKKIASNP